MNSEFRWKKLTVITLCIYLFWGTFGLDITIYHSLERFPLHRGLIVLTIFLAVVNSNAVFQTLSQLKYLFIMILYVLLSALWASDAEDVLKGFIFLISILFISICAGLVFESSRLLIIRYVFWLYLAMNLASIYVASQYPSLGTLMIGAKLRWVGITTHPNALGGSALLGMWLSTNLFFMSKSFLEKLICLFSAFVAFFIAIKADSMTGVIASAIVASLVIYFYIGNRLNFATKLIIGFCAIISIAGILGLMTSADEIVSGAFSASGRSTNFSGRTILWEKALIAATESPLFGYGFDGLEELTNKYHFAMSHMHNGYLELLVKGGSIAIFLIAMIFLKTINCLRKIRKTDEKSYIFLNTGFIMILLHSFTESSLFRGMDSLNIMFMFIAASSVVLYRKLKVS
ncbi:O-antigen ligase family protein [Methylomonas sp. AM2-LC]|uniref:O-antigen ligase family protein n=1 Tax=Methylomonas sp. AM2-LC TaxID=3153301 RepID=UPI0032668C4E